MAAGEIAKDNIGSITIGVQLIASIPLTRFINEPGTRYSYSNIGYAILGLALSRAAGEPYVEYVQEHILKPLGMSQTAFSLDERMKTNRAKGFLIEDGKVDAEEPERQEREGNGWRVPNGRLYSTGSSSREGPRRRDEECE